MIIDDLINEKFPGEWGSEANNGNGVNIIRTTNFQNNGLLNLGNVVKRAINQDILKKKKLLPGDLIIEKSGGSPNQPVGRVVYFNEINEIYLCNNFTAVLRPKDNINPKWLFYLLFYNHSVGKTLKYQNKTIGIINLQLERYLRESVYVPTLKKQNYIASILDEAFALIQKRQETISLTDEFLRSTFLEMFGDPFANRKGYKVNTLEELATDDKNSIVDGPFGSSIKQSDYQERGIPVVRVNNIRSEGFYCNDFKYISEQKYNDLIRSKIEYYDILLARVGNTIGKSCIFKHNFKALLSTTGVAKVSINKKKANIDFVWHQINLPQYKKYIWNQAEGGGQPYINLTKIKGFQLLLPPLEFQEKFAKIAIEAEILKENYKSSLLEMENLFNSLMQKAFSGKF